MTTQEAFRQWSGHDVVDQSGAKVGTVADIYFDDETGEPDWCTVKTGLFGSHVSFLPISGMNSDENVLVAPWTKAQVKDAPHIDPDGHLTPTQERELYEYYGLSYGDGDMDVDRDSDRGVVGRDTSGPETDTAMTRSEEELQVGTRRREAGSARLRKWVETETEAVSVPVSHEEIRVERESITDANIDDALDGPEISEEEHEVTLMEDEIVSSKQTVPKERVRLDKTTVTETETVEGEVRKEHIEVDGDVDESARR